MGWAHTKSGVIFSLHHQWDFSCTRCAAAFRHQKICVTLRLPISDLTQAQQRANQTTWRHTISSVMLITWAAQPQQNLVGFSCSAGFSVNAALCIKNISSKITYIQTLGTHIVNVMCSPPSTQLQLQKAHVKLVFLFCIVRNYTANSCKTFFFFTERSHEQLETAPVSI